MRTLIASFLCALAVLAAPAGAETRDPSAHFFQPKLGDFKAELDSARAEGKKGILLFYEMDECPFCARMKATVLNQSEVQDYYREHFLIYAIDTRGNTPMVDFIGRDTQEKDFALEQRARATPTFIFYDLQGRAIARYIGPTKDVAEFRLLGKYVVEGAYASQPFNAYKQAAR
jgi:thioredoxin-related protein